jgi:hypothetical protein
MAVQKEQFIVDSLTSLMHACCTKGLASKPTFCASLISTQQLRVLRRLWKTGTIRGTMTL